MVTAQYLICSDVDLLREPVTSWTEGSSNVASFNHLHQVSDDLGSRSNTQTGIHPHINISNPLHCKIKKLINTDKKKVFCVYAVQQDEVPSLRKRKKSNLRIQPLVRHLWGV